MRSPSYRYPVEECDVSVDQRPQLAAYRTFRDDCLKQLQGDTDTSVLSQILELTWHTLIFRTLNEARRIEESRTVNGAMWELITTGHATILTLGVRRLVDRHSAADSAWNVIRTIERRTELLTRQNFVCHDGLPFDNESAWQNFLSTRAPGSGPQWLATHGPNAFDSSARMHETFDALSGYPSHRHRQDRIQPDVFITLRQALEHSSIKRVCNVADKQIAHAERLKPNSPPISPITYNDVDEALSTIVRVCEFVSCDILGEGGFSSIVATPQFDVLEALDKPWCLSSSLSNLNDYWYETTRKMEEWASSAEELAPKRPS